MNPDYEILALLAEGGRFELLNARRVRTGAPVFVQRARPALRTVSAGADLAALQRACALIAASPGAATLLPRVIDGPQSALLVMEDPGGTLLARRLARGPLPVDAVLAIGIGLATALAALHRRGLLHNGLRPDAILCSADDTQAWLVDFADAGPAGSTSGSGGTPQRLVYVSPEQTGRVDRSADARSDLYSLGIVLYEMLTGAPPHRSDDALELIHWHIAGHALEPMRVDASIPPMLSALVMKLLERSPDDRYQSAAALLHDLAHCAREWAAHGHIAPFALGRHDVGERLVISSRLYGRERELHTLLEAFERACAGRAGRTMLLVEGYSGIGKTALIQELVRPIVRRKGYFLSGKFDQVVRGVPFGALIQAFRALVRQLLTESEAQLATWRETLAAALGGNGGVLAEVIPEIEFIVGPQPAPAALGSVEAQNRFQRVLQNFVAAIARPEHPLVLFLDDLQWADAATLALLEPMLTGDDGGWLMLMGAYRDNEPEATPRLARSFAALARSGVALQRVSLRPLAVGDLAELIADSLRIVARQAAPLAELVQRKTGGNPFFIVQFLKLLEREGHLRFDAEAGGWTYRIEQIADAPLADNVVELMTHSIQRLAPKSQYALTLAACIGNRFDAATLAIVSEQSGAATEADLEPAIAEGLIVAGTVVPGGTDERPSYTFLHDRVQQSAYALIPAERRAMVHLTVGRLLRSRARPEQLDAGAFDIVHHLNLGRRLIHASAERREVAALNLAAGRRAKSSTAHDSALELFEAGTELLGDSGWNDDYPLAFALQLEAAESRYLCGRFDAAQATFAALLARARSAVDRAQVVRLRSVAYENMARYAEALASAHEGLALFDLVFPTAEADKAAALEREIAAIDRLRAGRDIAKLVELPAMTDASVRMVMSMLTDMWSAAYILGDPTLARLISATMVRLSLEHGNVEESAYGYVTHAITVGPVRGEYPAAYAFGCLALEVNRRFDDARRRAKIHQQFHAHVNLWCQPFRTCMAYAREACRAGLDSGDFLYAAYGAGTEPWAALVATQDLDRFVHDYTGSVALIERLKNTGFADSLRAILNWAKALQGRTAAPLSLGDASFDEDDYLRRYGDNPFFASIHAVLKLHLATLLGTPDEALQAAQHSAALIGNVPGTVWPVIHEFWHGLALAANADTADAAQRAAWLAQMRHAQAGFEARAAHCAENFGAQSLLLAAEIARLEGRLRDAVELAEQAVEFAAVRPLLAHEAHAHELCARLRLRQGQPQLAALHLVQARERYARWGAVAKLQALAREFAALDAAAARPALLQPAEPEPLAMHGRDATESWRGTSADGLDLFSVLKASQVIATELELDALLARLLRIAIENAGAERGALVLESEAGALVHAADLSDAPGVEAGVALAESGRVPVGLVNYVRRTGAALRLAQAEIEESHGDEPYIALHRPRALMCLPVRKRGREIGVLYLEHRRVGDVFTPQRQRTLEVLATQAAVSIENARLFAGLRREVGERQQAQEHLAAALAEVERLKDDLEAENSYLRRDLIANVSHDLRTPLVSMRGYLEVLATRGDGLSTEQRAQYLGVAVRQSEHLAALIDELFELAKLDFRGATITREAFPFAELAADVLQKFQLAADAQRVRLVLDAPERLPFANADLSLMERVLENLIGNALQHTPAGGLVTVAVGAEPGALAVRVSDTGRGIARGELQFIFDRFYRGENGRHGAAGGAGLGLAIAKRIVDLHGGEIGVRSCIEPEGATGSCFHFRLPLMDSS